MNHRDLSFEQLRKLRDGLSRGKEYLARVSTRLKVLGFPSQDPMFSQVKEACDANDRLAIWLNNQLAHEFAGPRTKRPRR